MCPFSDERDEFRLLTRNEYPCFCEFCWVDEFLTLSNLRQERMAGEAIKNIKVCDTQHAIPKH